MLNFTVSEVREFIQEPQGEDAWKATLTDEQIHFVERCKASGMFDAFKALLPYTSGSVPRFAERYLVTFFKTASDKRIPKFALDIFIKQFGGIFERKRVGFVSAQGIGLVTSDKHPVLFVPLRLVAGDAVSSLSGNNASRLQAEEEPLLEWIKTKMGYVPMGSPFVDEMRRKSIGEFANPVL